MNVAILDDHPDLSRYLLRKAWTAARCCYSTDTPSVLWEKSDKLSEAKMLKVVEDEVISSRHLSVLRHLTLTYAIDGISRSCAQQLTRHTAGFAFEMQSQRYAKIDPASVVVPPSVAGYGEWLPTFEAAVEDASQAFSSLVEMGVPREDARYLLPLAAQTNLTMTVNANALINLCEARLCIRAQHEIRRLVAQIRAVTGKRVPWLKKHLIISCMRTGICYESSNKSGQCTIRPHISAVDIVKR